MPVRSTKHIYVYTHIHAYRNIFDVSHRATLYRMFTRLQHTQEELLGCISPVEMYAVSG